MKKSCWIHCLTIWAALLFLFAGSAVAAQLSNTPPTKSLELKPTSKQTLVQKAPSRKCPELKFVTPDILPTAQVERDYNYRLMACGGSGNLVFVLAERESLPVGLKLTTDGFFTGRPAKEGDFVFSVLVQDNCPVGSQQVRKKFALKVISNVRLTRPATESQIGPALTPPNISQRSIDSLKPKPQLNPSHLEIKTLASEIKKVPAASVKTKQDKPQASHVSGQIVVTMHMDRGEALVRQLQIKYKLSLIESFTIRTLRQMVATFRTDQDLTSLIPKISKESGVIFAQKNQIYGTFAEPKSDLQNLGVQLDFPKLHKHRRGKKVLVALIDTGVDLSHEDLKDRVIYSQNYIKNSSYRAEVHGTAVAGIIAAGINNFGIEGIAPEADLLALRACEQVSEKETVGKGYTTSIIQALDTAIEKKARVVNMSFGSHSPDPIIASLIAEGVRQGILFVAPVGNLAGQKYPAFPASCRGVIAVGGLDEQGNHFPDNHLVSFAKALAPAENIFTTTPGNKHNFMTGTSFSSAIVAGVLALGVESNPQLSLNAVPEKNNDLKAWAESLFNGQR